MREPFDESRLTAYALGELSEKERLEVEARLVASPKLRAELEAIRGTADALREALAAPTADALTPDQRLSILAEAGPSRALPFAARRRWLTPGSITAAAASLAIVSLVSWQIVSRHAAPMPAPATAAVSPRPIPSLDRSALEESQRMDEAWKQRSSADPRERTMLIEQATSLQRLAVELQSEQVAQKTAGSPFLSKEAADRLRALGYIGPDGGPVGTEADLGIRQQTAPFVTDAYDHIRDNPFVLVAQDPRSTFSVDVDTASYSIVRRHLDSGSLPPKDAVRIEELVNYFHYDYAPPTGPHPFAVHMEAARCPWTPAHRLVRIGLKGRELPRGERPPGNLVFLLDVSGSMDQPTKLPLVKDSMKLLVGELSPQDRVAIVVYAGAQGLALPSTPASEKDRILAALDRLSAGGTTHGSAGLRLAYETAEANFVKGGINRVILATDGDFNVGITNQGDLIRLIEAKAKNGVSLTTLGFGMGNLKDSTLEKLADHGNGNYAYIDTLWEARKVLVEQIGATLVTIAKDVKLQLEWNPATVKAFRLIGYENRVLTHQDFNDDKKDAGDIGAGHTVTALYEVVPLGGSLEVPGVDPLKYQDAPRPNRQAEKGDLLTVKLRYKQPDGDKSTLLEETLANRNVDFGEASTDFRFASAVASFGMLLRDSPFKGDSQFERTLAWAKESLGPDKASLRAEFVTLVEKARRLQPRRPQ